jgi:hypothetical protein
MNYLVVAAKDVSPANRTPNDEDDLRLFSH